MLHNKYLILFFSYFFFLKSYANRNNVFLCYGKVPVHEIMNYTYVIIEASYYNSAEVAILKQHNQYVLSYISIGEINKYTSFYKKGKAYTIPGKNNIWNSYYLDIKQKPLQKIILEDINNKINTKGFDGLFLDNVDNYGNYGKQKHLRTYLISFLKNLRQVYPNIFLMQNAGLDLVNETHGLINSIGIESIITAYDFEQKKYLFRAKNELKTKISLIKKIEKEYTIPFIIIEYMDSKKGKNKILRKMKKFKWDIFIGQIDLQTKPVFK